MSTDGDYFVIQDQGQSLTVVRPTTAEVGTYRCVARNRAGEDSHSYQLSVIGKFSNNQWKVDGWRQLHNAKKCLICLNPTAYVVT